MKRKWIVKSFIGIDGSAESYEAESKGKKSTDYLVFLKLKPHGNSSFISEMDFYKRHANDAEIAKWITHQNIKYNDLGIPRYIGHGKNVKLGNTNFDFIILERYGSDLETLLINHNNLFPKNTSLKIAYLTLRVLEYFHARGFVHGDVQGSNIRLGRHNKNCVYLLPQVHSMDKFSPKAIMFWSEDRHNGVGTKIGDFESLLYSLIDWSGGILPWKNALPGVAMNMKIEAFANPKKFLQDAFPSCNCNDSSRCLVARKCVTSGNIVASSECLQAITEFMEHIVFLKKIDNSNPNYGVIKVEESIRSQALFATDDCPSVGAAEKPTQKEHNLSLSRCRNLRNNSSGSLSEMRRTLQNAFSSPLPELNGFQNPVSPASSSGYSSCRSSRTNVHSVQHQPSKKITAKTKVAAGRKVTGRQSVVPVDWEEWPDTCEWLTNWIEMIEPNLRVFRTPIPSKPEFVAKQMQKVRVLLSAFNMQDTVDRLNHLVDALDKMPPHSTDAKKLKQIEQRWRDGLALLEKRGRQLGRTIVDQLRDVLKQMSNSLDKLLVNEEQLLHELETLAEQLQLQQTLIVNTETVVKQLTEVLDDFNLEVEYQTLNKLYKNLQQRIEVKKAEIEKSIDDSCEKINVWMAKDLRTLEQLVVSADRATLQKQREYYKTVCQCIMLRETEVKKLMEKSGVLSRPPNLKNGILQQRVLDLHSRWEHLIKRSTETDIKLQSSVEHCNKYYETRDLFMEWLGEAERKSMLSNDIRKQLEDLTVFGNEVRGKSDEFERIVKLADTFVSACDKNGDDMVKNEIFTIKDRWHKLNEDLRDRMQSLLDLTRHSDDLKESLHKIEQCVDELVSHDILGGAAKEPEILNCFKELAKNGRA